MANTTPIVATVTKTTNKEKTQKEMDKVNIQDFCEEHYDDILPIIMDKVRRDKRKKVHARLDFGESSKKGQRAREGSHNSSASVSPVRYHTPSRRPRVQDHLRYNDGNVFNRLSRQALGILPALEVASSVETIPKIETTFASLKSRTMAQDAKGRPGRTLELRGCGSVYTLDSQLQKLEEDANAQQRETYDGTGDPEDRLKVFQASAQVERWAIPTWYHMFNSTLIEAARVWFDELPSESIDNYKDLKAAFFAYFMQHKKHVKDPVEIHNIKQKDGETIEEFMECFKVETRRIKGASECMKISGFMHGVNNLELTKRLNERVPKTLEEMMTMTTAFIWGETAAVSKKKVHTPWKPQDQSKRQTSERRSDFQNQPRDGYGSNKFTPLNRTPKEIFATKSEKFKPPPPMVTPAGKRSSNKFCKFHNDKGHSTDECMQLKKQIEELVKAGKLSHFIKEIRQDRNKQKNGKNEALAKEEAVAIYMIQLWHKVTRQKVTLSFAHVNEIAFPPLSANKGTEGPLVIEAEIEGYVIHHMYVDGGSSMEVLYKHCFNRLQPEIKSQMVPATTSLTGFSGETIWPLGQLRLLVTTGDAKHFTKAWMNFMIVRSPSSYNGIIRRPGIREI
ncbi:reverse transcriptase domain-containing protein [Tanacetum coccineum]